MSTNIYKDEIIGRNLLSLFIISGIVFSTISFFVLNDDMKDIFLTTSDPVSTKICENGLCYFKDAEENYSILVQQEEKFSETQPFLKNEDFTNLKLGKNVPLTEPMISENKVTLFAEKDSFIREGVQNSNEGSSHVLKIMGSGPTNNRALIAFNQEDIKTITDGKTLDSATIRLYIDGNNQNWGNGQYIDIYKLETNWEEGNGLSAPVFSPLKPVHGVTWECAVDSDDCTKWNGGIFNQKPTDSIVVSNEINGYWIKFDVTQDILEFVSTDENFGWIIMKSDEETGGQINISSRESIAHNPELVLVFSND
jgi:hypothetical protein